SRAGATFAANSKSRVCDRSTTAIGSKPDLMDCSRLPLVRKLMPKIEPNSNGIPTTAKMYPLRVTVTRNSRFAMTQTLFIGLSIDRRLYPSRIMFTLSLNQVDEDIF